MTYKGTGKLDTLRTGSNFTELRRILLFQRLLPEPVVTKVLIEEISEGIIFFYTRQHVVVRYLHEQHE